MKNIKLLIVGTAIVIFAISFTGNKLLNLKQEDSSPHECSSSCCHSDDEFKTLCKEASSGKNYLTNIVSYEKDTIDGTLQVTVIFEAEDTSYIGNVFSFETQGISFSGGGIYHTNRDSLMPGDTMQFHFSVTYDTTNLPYYPEDLYFTVTDSLNSDTTLRKYTSRAKVYFTPWNTVELWSFDDFHSQKRVWLKREGTPDRIFINKNSLPVSDIIDTIPDDAFYRHVEGLAYAIPFIEPDTFNWDYPYDTTGGAMMIPGGGRNVDRRDDGCGWWRREFTARIQNLRIFTWYNPPNGGNTRVWLKNATVKVYVDRWPASKVADLRTDNEGYIVDGNGNRTINLEYCAG